MLTMLTMIAASLGTVIIIALSTALLYLRTTVIKAKHVCLKKTPTRLKIRNNMYR
jgi:hypothetical protein